MMPDSRSMNLSNAVSVVVYEAWRQLGIPARYCAASLSDSRIAAQRLIRATGSASVAR
jgi:tRNA C32,U32 (ribose-2'-O)-methylase TrmJ